MEEEVVSEQERVRNVEPRVLDLFWKLAEFPDSVRVSAAVSLVNIVIQKQRLSKDGSLSREADYCLKRLIRGLASSRASARLGFFACLEGFLSRVHDVDAPFTLDTISEEFRLPKNASKSEKTEAQIGKVLAITALIRSGSLFREARPGCSKTLKECVEVIISNLLMLGLKKHFLDILTSSAMAQLVEKAPEEELGQIVIPALKACVEANKSGSSPLLLWPVLLASERLPGGVSVELLSSCGLEGRSAFSEENCGVVGQAIMATSDSLPAAVHPFCSVAIRMFCERGLIVPLWTSGILSAINEDSRANKGSALPRHKAQLLLHLFAMAVEHVKKATEFTALLLPPLLPLLLSTAHHARSSSPGKPLPQGAERAALNALCRRFSAPDNPTTEKARRKVLKMLLTPPDGRVDLDALLGHHVTLDIIRGASDPKTIRTVAQACHIVLDDADPTTSTRPRNQIIYASQLLSRVIHHPCMDGEMEWKEGEVAFLAKLALCSPPEWAKGDGGKAVIQGFRQSLFRALDREASGKKSGLEERCHLLEVVCAAATAHGGVRHLSPEASRWWKTAQKEVKLLNKEKPLDDDAKWKAGLFKILFLQVALNLFEDEQDAIDILKDLVECLAQSSQGKAPCQGNEAGPPEEAPPHWTHVVIEVLLSLLSRESKLMRGLGACVFRLLTPHVTPEAIKVITRVFDPKIKSIAALTSDVPDEAEDEEDDEDDDSSVSDREEKMPEEEEEDSGSEEDDSAAREIDSAFRDRVKDALGDANQGTDIETINLSDVDQDQLKSIDEALSLAFQAAMTGKDRKPRGRKLPSKELRLMHFRLRVLDLLEAYLKATPDLSVLLECLPPLTVMFDVALRDLRMEPLQLRLAALMKRLSGTRKVSVSSQSESSSVALASVEEVLASLSALITGGSEKKPFPLLVEWVSVVYALFLRTFQHSSESPGGRQRLELMGDKYVEALDCFLSKSDSLLASSFFLPALSSPWVGLPLLTSKLASVAFDKEKLRPYRRTQVLGLLGAVARNRKATFEEEDAQAILRLIVEGACKELRGVRERSDLKVRHAAHMFALLTQVVSSPASPGGQCLTMEVLPEEAKRELQEALIEFRGRFSMKALGDLRKPFRRLLARLQQAPRKEGAKEGSPTRKRKAKDEKPMSNRKRKKLAKQEAATKTSSGVENRAEEVPAKSSQEVEDAEDTRPAVQTLKGRKRKVDDAASSVSSPDVAAHQPRKRRKERRPSEEKTEEESARDLAELLTVLTDAAHSSQDEVEEEATPRTRRKKGKAQRVDSGGRKSGAGEEQGSNAAEENPVLAVEEEQAAPPKSKKGRNSSVEFEVSPGSSLTSLKLKRKDGKVASRTPDPSCPSLNGTPTILKPPRSAALEKKNVRFSDKVHVRTFRGAAKKKGQLFPRLSL